MSPFGIRFQFVQSPQDTHRETHKSHQEPLSIPRPTTWPRDRFSRCQMPVGTLLVRADAVQLKGTENPVWIRRAAKRIGTGESGRHSAVNVEALQRPVHPGRLAQQMRRRSFQVNSKPPPPTDKPWVLISQTWQILTLGTPCDPAATCTLGMSRAPFSHPAAPQWPVALLSASFHNRQR